MTRLAHLLRRRPDAAIAAALLLFGIVEAVVVPRMSVGLQLLLTIAWTVPLAWRRRFPVPVLALVLALGPAQDLIDTQGGVMSYVLAAVLAAYTVGRELDAPSAWWGPGLILGVGWVFYAAAGGSLSDFVFIALLYGGAWAVGAAIRHRDLRVGELTEEASELRLRQVEREQRAVEAERARIARDLHDIVSHSISVITIQTQAVRRRLDPSNAAEIDDLRAIEQTARQAMAEMRRLLGVLRSNDDAAELAPQPGLDQLSRLIDEARTGGTEIEVQVVGRPQPLPPGVDLAAYRIVQEALTNARKHAHGARLTVRLEYDDVDGRLGLQVEDDGAVDGSASSDGAGYGLVGMRERVGLYGGSLDAGRTDGGGFRVHATLPFRYAARVAG